MHPIVGRNGPVAHSSFRRPPRNAPSYRCLPTVCITRTYYSITHCNIYRLLQPIPCMAPHTLYGSIDPYLVLPHTLSLPATHTLYADGNYKTHIHRTCSTSVHSSALTVVKQYAHLLLYMEHVVTYTLCFQIHRVV
jgi:hypothetical protein